MSKLIGPDLQLNNNNEKKSIWHNNGMDNKTVLLQSLRLVQINEKAITLCCPLQGGLPKWLASSVTILGDLLYFGQIFIAFGNN